MSATNSSKMCLIAVALLVNAAATYAYTNHTVGGGAGWFFNSTINRTSADYNTWAANQTFSLGDYLIFNTNTNQTVIQTYNKTTYDSCSIDDALDTDTFQIDGGSNGFRDEVTIPVPLTIQGTQYYFSAASDGEQCRHGMAFQIKVDHGQGLPPNLNLPPPPPYAPPPSPSVDGQSPPTTAANNPRNAGEKIGYRFSWLVLVTLGLLFSWHEE